MGKALKYTGIVVGGLLAVVAIAAGVVFGTSQYRLGRKQVIKAEALPIPDDSATRAYGEHLATAISKCTECHGENLQGTVFINDPAFGLFVAPNLTAGKGGRGPLTDEQWIRAIRHGVAADGRPLLFMPSMLFSALDEKDLTAIIAWAKSRPPVDNEPGVTKPGPIARVAITLKPGRLLAAGVIDHAAPPPAPVPHQPTVEFGKYLTVVGGCVYCHGENLKGGIQEGGPDVPPSADLTETGRPGQWTERDFFTALRNGLRPDGSLINPFMPWRATRLMTDDEIRAVWMYLKSLKG